MALIESSFFALTQMTRTALWRYLSEIQAHCFHNQHVLGVNWVAMPAVERALTHYAVLDDLTAVMQCCQLING